MNSDPSPTDLADALDPPVGASMWERELFEHLADHGRREGAMLEQYVAAAEATGSKALAYVIGMLAEDERRHHRQMAELLQTVKHEAELRRDEPAVPRMDFDKADMTTVRELTTRLIADEKLDAATLKRLRKDLDDVEHTTLWALIVDTMRADTDKHLAMLKFVEKHLPRH